MFYESSSQTIAVIYEKNHIFFSTCKSNKKTPAEPVGLTEEWFLGIQANNWTFKPRADLISIEEIFFSFLVTF